MPPSSPVPGYVAGTWDIDPYHSEVGFIAKHLMVSKVRGRFTEFSGEIVTAADPTESSVTVTIEPASITTGIDQRDDHIRTADFLEVEAHPTMTYRSTGVRQADDGWIVDGELTLRGVSRPVPLTVEPNGFGPHPAGTVAGFSATAEINRRDFGVSWSATLDGGGVVVGDVITITLEIEAVLRTD